MSKVLVDPSDEELAKAIIDNHISYMRLLGETPYVKEIDNEDYFQVDFGLRCYSAQGIYYFNVELDRAEEQISKKVSYFEELRQPFTWGVLPYTQPEDLGERLISHGFTYDGPYPGMAVKLSEVKDTKRRIEGFSFKVVDSVELCKTFWDVWGDGYPQPQPFEDVAYNCYSYRGFNDVPYRLYLGYLDGEAVGTSKLLLAEGVAGVHDVTVLPSARGKGVGTEMSLIPLRDARSRGYNFGVLCATGLGLKVYRKLGFREYVRWEWYSKFKEFMEN